MKRKIQEWLSIQIAKNPGRMVLAGILIFNIVFILISAVIIKNLSLAGTEQMGFLEAAFCTITMILDAGCISFVVSDIGNTGIAIVVICLAIIVIGMISFTGAVIGYVTNMISGFIESADSNSRKLKLSGHIVILNWNTRASEIINDLLYLQSKQKVVVLVGSRKKEITDEIRDRLADTVSRENAEIQSNIKSLNFVKHEIIRYKNKFKNKLAVIVREGDVYSSKQLHDISLERAKTIIILGNDFNNTICKYEHQERLNDYSRGNSQTVKTLMQVSDITAADYSDDNQKIVVEITDSWTNDLVDRIIKYKQRDQKCHIFPIRVNMVLGQILSQFSLMPELNLVYNELFSNDGASFYSTEETSKDDETFAKEYLNSHSNAIPLSAMEQGGKKNRYFSAASENDIRSKTLCRETEYRVNLNSNYWIEQKNVIILGHNSNSEDIMRGFAAFRAEWHYRDRSDEILRIVIIDDQKSLEKENYYKDYPFVIKTVAAGIYDKELICSTISEFVDPNAEDTSILILSDDTALNEDVDANALANLVYIQDIINEKKATIPDFDGKSIDVVVEIINPKHHDVVRSYSINNVVISNRYISKMILQIGEKEALFNFYSDILTYDTGDSMVFESKEIYTKKVSRLFNEIPKPCTAYELIRAVYYASIDPSLPEDKRNPTIPLGYVKPGGRITLFTGNQDLIKVNLEERDKIIVFSNH